MDMASVSLTFSSSIAPSPIPQSKFTRTHNNPTRPKVSTFRITYCAISPPPSKTASNSSPVVKKKHWKQGEFPGFSQSEGSTRRGPIKKLKQKIDRKNNAKAWVNTVTEALSERVDKKQWLQALEVDILASFAVKFH